MCAVCECIVTPQAACEPGEHKIILRAHASVHAQIFAQVLLCGGAGLRLAHLRLLRHEQLLTDVCALGGRLGVVLRRAARERA